MVQPAHWIDASPAARIPIDSIATLGPEGTSSENAARYLWNSRGGGGDPVVLLYSTYEDAGDALREGIASHLVAANAYSAINAFYMDPGLSLAAAFVCETPPYGLASPNPAAVPQLVTVASHPAPVPLVDELLPAGYALAGILRTDSTSAAAIKAQRLEIDLALTTQPAAAVHKLQFISRTRTIQMLWSVFTVRQR
ncbi:MAG TPA: hypothetical protein VNF47_14955 [Streptosporangiaceae bacterium]|nr:hypothetical protein [Streptosporangiaceae bacterium]